MYIKGFYNWGQRYQKDGKNKNQDDLRGAIGDNT
jgi:hypothetical protein